MGIVLGSLLIGFTVERTSYAAGFALELVGLGTFVRGSARARIGLRPPTEVSSSWILDERADGDQPGEVAGAG